MDGIDYVRVVLFPVQYDKDLVAIPKPVSLQFLADKKIVCESKDRELVSRFRPKKNRIILTDEITDEHGNKRYIRVKTKDGQHTLSEMSGPYSWFDVYHNELFSRQ